MTGFRWWHVTGLVIVALYMVFAVQNFFFDGTLRDAVLTSVFAAVLLAGLFLWRTSRRAGGVVIIVGVVPAIIAYWTIIGPLCAIATIVGVLLELPLGRRTPVIP